jgi:hypothetical protein
MPDQPCDLVSHAGIHHADNRIMLGLLFGGFRIAGGLLGQLSSDAQAFGFAGALGFLGNGVGRQAVFQFAQNLVQRAGLLAVRVVDGLIFPVDLGNLGVQRIDQLNPFVLQLSRCAARMFDQPLGFNTVRAGFNDWRFVEEVGQRDHCGFGALKRVGSGGLLWPIRAMSLVLTGT